jgi:hypothetical protein
MKLFSILLLLVGVGILNAEEMGQVPSDLGVAPVSGEASAAEEGLEMEEGVDSPYVESGLTEGQQLYLDKQAQEKENIEQEDADSRQLEAESAATEALESPYEGVEPVGAPLEVVE